MAVSILWVLVIIDESISLDMLLGPLFLFGVSIGLAVAQLTTVIMTDVPLSSAGDASAAKSSISPVGNSFGASFVGILIVISINDVLIMALIFVFIAARFGLGSEKLTSWFKKNLAMVKLLSAAFFILMAVLLVIL